MKKILEVEKITQANFRAEAKALEESFSLNTGLKKSEEFFNNNYNRLTSNEKLAILNQELHLIDKIRDMFNLKEVFEKGKYVVYAEIK